MVLSLGFACGACGVKYTTLAQHFRWHPGCDANTLLREVLEQSWANTLLREVLEQSNVWTYPDMSCLWPGIGSSCHVLPDGITCRMHAIPMRTATVSAD
jgi:hypothetical protein